jgi:hypothetical protein
MATYPHKPMHMQLSIVFGLLFAAALKASGQVTEAPGITYNPGEDCLPYDDSVWSLTAHFM